MTEKFLQKVLAWGTVDTRKYRYNVREDNQDLIIERLPLEYLDTTRAIDGWEEVKRIED